MTMSSALICEHSLDLFAGDLESLLKQVAALLRPLLNAYPRSGNLAAASIPAGITSAVADHSIGRGDRILCFSASAGIAFSAYSFVYERTRWMPDLGRAEPLADVPVLARRGAACN